MIMNKMEELIHDKTVELSNMIGVTFGQSLSIKKALIEIYEETMKIMMQNARSNDSVVINIEKVEIKMK